MGKKISIITITYNSEDVIEYTMKSVLQQTYRPLEYIIVDGDSTDNTIRIIESYIPRFLSSGIGVSFKSEADRGISDAFNKGISRATGDIIGITNADDSLLPGTLDFVADNFPEDVDVFYGNILWEDRTKGVSYVRKSSSDLSDLKFRLKALHPAVYIRRSAYEKYGVYDVNYRYCMDKELLARFQRLGARFLYADKTLVSVAAGGVSDKESDGVITEGVSIAIANGVPVSQAEKYFKKGRLKTRFISVLKRLPVALWLISKVKKDSDALYEKCKKKDYLYDLYRWTRRVDCKTWLRWVLNPKYKIVYLYRKCRKYRRKNKFVFTIFRVLYEHYSVKYGIDIGTSTEIGQGFIMRHVGGIAINGGAIIGKDCEILQGVTIGYERRGKRQGNPTIGDRVWIGSNAIIVGNIRVGNNVLIAPGAFVNFDVPDNSIVIGNPGKIIPSEKATDGYVVNTLDL